MIIRPACMEALLDMGKALGRVEEHMDRVLGEDASKEGSHWRNRSVTIRDSLIEYIYLKI